MRRKRMGSRRSARKQMLPEEGWPNGSGAVLKDSLSKVTVAEFKECMQEQNLQVLVISGQPAEAELQEVWNDLLSDYYKTTGNGEMKMFIRLMSRYRQYAIRVQAVYHVLNAVRQVLFTCKGYKNFAAIYAELNPLFDELRRLGYDRRYSIETIVADLNFVEHGEKRFIADMNRTKAAIKRDFNLDMDNPEQEARAMGAEDYFILQMDEIRKFDNYQKDPESLMHEMMMSTYCRALARIKKHNEHLEKINKDGK